MKAVILAGGLGTRISEETQIKPSPWLKLRKPILWHILKIFSAHGIDEFIICCGYKGYIIKEYFLTTLHMSDVSIDMTMNSMEVLQKLSLENYSGRYRRIHYDWRTSKASTSLCAR